MDMVGGGGWETQTEGERQKEKKFMRKRAGLKRRLGEREYDERERRDVSEE